MPHSPSARTAAGSLRKVFNAVGVVFKGSGFYRTDSRVGAKNGAGSDGGDSAGAGKKDDGGRQACEEGAGHGWQLVDERQDPLVHRGQSRQLSLWIARSMAIARP